VTKAVHEITRNGTNESIQNGTKFVQLFFVPFRVISWVNFLPIRSNLKGWPFTEFPREQLARDAVAVLVPVAVALLAPEAV